MDTTSLFLLILSKYKLPVITMIARSFNIVEIAQITSILSQFIYLFDQAEGE